MIYVPDLTNYKCFVVRNDSTIRAYKQIPRNNTDVEYRDYFYTANYLYQDGTQSFSTYTTLPVCLDSSVLTTDYQYRNDYADILIIFLIYCLFGIYLPLKIFMRLFKKGRYLWVLTK